MAMASEPAAYTQGLAWRRASRVVRGGAKRELAVLPAERPPPKVVEEVAEV
jgi:hypothetical protein